MSSGTPETLIDEEVEIKDDVDLNFSSNKPQKKFRLSVTASTKDVSVLMLTDIDTGISAYLVNTMGGPDNMEIGMRIKNINYKAYCFLK